MAMSKLDRIAATELKIEQLKKQKAQYLKEHNAQQRKARNHRLIKRSAFIEKALPGLAELTDEQFDTFVKRTLLTGAGEKILREIGSAKPKEVPASNSNTSPAQENKTPTNKQPVSDGQAAPSLAGNTA